VITRSFGPPGLEVAGAGAGAGAGLLVAAVALAAGAAAAGAGDALLEGAGAGVAVHAFVRATTLATCECLPPRYTASTPILWTLAQPSPPNVYGDVARCDLSLARFDWSRYGEIACLDRSRPSR
jgi:hypothetical protein